MGSFGEATATSEEEGELSKRKHEETVSPAERPPVPSGSSLAEPLPKRRKDDGDAPRAGTQVSVSQEERFEDAEWPWTQRQQDDDDDDMERTREPPSHQASRWTAASRGSSRSVSRRTSAASSTAPEGGDDAAESDGAALENKSTEAPQQGEDGDADNHPTVEDGGTTASPYSSLNAALADVRAFLNSPGPLGDPKVVEESNRRIAERLDKPLSILEEKPGAGSVGGYQVYLNWLKERATGDSKHYVTQKERMAQLLAEATIQGDPRDYQRAMFELAKERNTIVHLGTGYGKTLIALLLIKYRSKDWEDSEGKAEQKADGNTDNLEPVLASPTSPPQPSPKDRFEKKQQTLFLVPSVALAIQQSTTLRANLPFTVETACYATSNTPAYRQQLHKARILVATHGAMMDLLMHYGDMFRMSRFNLLVMDECHYCTGNHSFAIIMNKFYHTLPQEDRPYILGLTASPLVNVRDKHSDQDLDSMLSGLERTLDSTLASAESLIIKHNARRGATVEKVIQYQGTNKSRWLPSADNLPLHQSRFREFRQLQHLYQDLGPLPVSLYCSVLVEELSRNKFENESPQEFQSGIHHLKRVVRHCDQECFSFPHYGRTDKLMALQEVMEQEIEQQAGTETVGLVFTDRRIMAMALHNYFRWRNQKLDEVDAAADETKPLDADKLSWWHRAALYRRRKNLHQTQDKWSVPAFGSNATSDVEFEDSEDDPFFEFQKSRTTKEKDQKEAMGPENAALSKLVDRLTKPDPDDVFGDADEDSIILEETSNSTTLEDEDENITQGNATIEPIARINKIHSTTLVRSVTQIFNSLSISRKWGNDTEEYTESWLHLDNKVKSVLTKLRRKELNLLFATSVVEEGVDVQACSFVIAFDSLKSTKSYIQMKGRARKKDAKLFVFEDALDPSSSNLSLASAQEMEQRIHMFIGKKTKSDSSKTIDKNNQRDKSKVHHSEIKAVREGFFRVENAVVGLSSAKSLLNRYALAVPLDPFVRGSKESLLSHMPIFRLDKLILPSHLPRRVRTVCLPKEFLHSTKKEKEKMLSLMACVRLHSLGLLNDRLLPLTRKDMYKQILGAGAKRPATISTLKLPLEKFYEHETMEIIIYSINYTGEKFSSFERKMGSKGHKLCLVTFEPLDAEIPPLNLRHLEMGMVSVSLGRQNDSTCSRAEFSILQRTFILLFNERWRRRSRNMYFKMREKSKYEATTMPYLVGILSKEDILDWTFMNQLLAESGRTDMERKEAVMKQSVHGCLPPPRLWRPIYDPYVQYIAYGPSNETCSSSFPSEIPNVETYHEYFTKVKGFSVPKEDPLIEAQRYWSIPSTIRVYREGDETSEDCATSMIDAKYEVCPELHSVKLPRSACIESVLANAHVALLSTFLPQILFVYERYKNAQAFLAFCSENLPETKKYLSKVPLRMVLSAMTAKSCALDTSYEKLEWLGDAVLKIIQTDTLLKSTALKDWITLLHEGDLSSLRQAMGSNKRLAEVCSSLGLEKYIMYSALARGQWLPSCLDFEDGTILLESPSQGNKMSADILESLLGLVYVGGGYKAALAVGDELGVTVDWADPRPTKNSRKDLGDSRLSYEQLRTVQQFTGYSKFRDLERLEEAFVHPTADNPNVSSYQRLEWVGDAVLCLASREWIYNTFPNITLGSMVTMEGALVSNEILAFLSVRMGFHPFLDHNDYVLPPKIESYIWSLQEEGRGLWGTDPPKAISDIVESVLGAIHTDGGFDAGQAAALKIVSPICDALLENYKSNGNAIVLTHPKKALQEMTGELFSLETSWEHDILQVFGGMDAKSKVDRAANFSLVDEVLDGKKWRPINLHSPNVVGHVNLMNHILVGVTDSSVVVARNQACNAIVKALRANPELYERVKVCRHELESTFAVSYQALQVERQNLHQVTNEIDGNN